MDIGPSQNITFLSQDVDYLGFLRTKLRDLNGIKSMAYELIQNADDVKDDEGRPITTKIAFDFRDDALEVSNDGVFRPRDFERMRSIASGDKRFEEGTTGNFGIGFISVYQVTDSPEIVSSGRRWRIKPAEASERRIEQAIDVQTRETTFRLPWAFDPNSQVRQALQRSEIRVNEINDYCNQVAEAIRDAALFLKQLIVLEVLRNGSLVRRVERRLMRDNLLTLQEEDRSTEWIILTGEFDEQARSLRQNYPHILPKRTSTVQIAIERSVLTMGCLYTTLPTEVKIDPLPFHINADFVPTSDRKRIIFENGADSEWNRAAIRAAAHTLAKHISLVKSELVSHVEFWKVIDAVETVSKNASAGQIDRAFTTFLEALSPKLYEEPVIYTADLHWALPRDVRLPITSPEQQATPIFQELGIQVPHSDLRGHFNTMRGLLKMAPLRLNDIALAFRRHGLNQSTQLSKMPPALQILENWPVLWAALEAIYANQSGRTQDIDLIAMRDCSIAMTEANEVCPPSAVYRSKSAFTKKIFSDVCWLTTEVGSAFVDRIVSEFQLDDAIKHIKRQPEDGGFVRDLDEARFDIADLYHWLDDRKSALTPEQKDALRLLPIWQSAEGLQPLTNLYIPGDFSDPLGLSTLVHDQLAQDFQGLLKSLGAKVLTFITYVCEKLPTEFSQNNLTLEQRRNVGLLLAKKLGELQGNAEAQRILRSLPLVECRDGKFRATNGCYIHTEELELFIPNAPFAVRNEDFPSLEGLYRWLGINSVPRPEDVILRIQSLVAHPPTPLSKEGIEIAFDYLVEEGRRHSADLSLYKVRFAELRTLSWLMSERDSSRWYAPAELYTHSRQPLFASQADFIAVKRDIEREAAKMGLLEYLGCKDSPSTQLVVRHILHCSKLKNTSLSLGVYQRLNQTPDDPSIATLKDEACLLIKTEAEIKFVKPNETFWKPHRFGTLRYQLGPEFTEYRQLLDRLGVREEPTIVDCVSVLLEIEHMYDSNKSLLEQNSDIRSVVLGCWKTLNEFLLKSPDLTTKLEQTPVEVIHKLHNHKVIPNEKHLLIKPEMTFIEDRPGWAGKFQQLQNDIIPRYSDLFQAMEAAGARSLSQSELQFVETEDARDDVNVKDRIVSRNSALTRVLEAGNIDLTSLDKLLSSIRISRYSRLRVQYKLNAFKSFISEPEDVLAVYDAVNHEMHINAVNGYSWTSISRELAYALSQSAEIGNLAGTISHVLMSNSDQEAHLILDELGCPVSQRAFESVNLPVSVADRIDLEQDFTLRDEKDEPSVSCDQLELAAQTGSLRTPGLPKVVGNSVPATDANDRNTTSSVPDRSSTVTQDHGVAKNTKPQIDKDDALLGLLPLVSKTAMTQSRTTSKKQRPSKTYEVLRSYVHHSEAGDRITDSALASHREAVDKAGIQRVMLYELACGRKPQEQEHFNEGFDILSSNVDEKRFIEVKSLDCEWQSRNPAGLSSAQFRLAYKTPDEFWLYVVEFARDSDRYKIYAIQSPAQRVTKFMFDDGWRDVADECFPR